VKLPLVGVKTDQLLVPQESLSLPPLPGTIAWQVPLAGKLPVLVRLEPIPVPDPQCVDVLYVTVTSWSP
jgi:hypothetical protein